MKTQSNPKAIYTKFKKTLDSAPAKAPQELKTDEGKEIKLIAFRGSLSYKRELVSLAYKKEMSMQAYIVTALEFYKQHG